MGADIGQIFAGLVLLIFGGEYLVKGASRVANQFGISPLVIGLTVVAFGTSAPEMFVSIIASLKGNPDIAVANVLGSNIFNLCFILGLCGVIHPLSVHLQIIKTEVPILIGVSALAWFFFSNGTLSQNEGLLLLALALLYTAWVVSAAKQESPASNLGSEFTKNKDFQWSNFAKNCGLILGSLVTLVFGSRFLVAGATSLAKDLGVSESLIGLTIVAAGTSLPEVATSVMATIRRQTDIAIGNVIGSNLFNILLILGGSAVLNKEGLTISPVLLKIDVVVMFGTTLLALPIFISGKKVSRLEGLALLGIFTTYTTYLVWRG